MQTVILLQTVVIPSAADDVLEEVTEHDDVTRQKDVHRVGRHDEQSQQKTVWNISLKIIPKRFSFTYF